MAGRLQERRALVVDIVTMVVGLTTVAYAVSVARRQGPQTMTPPAEDREIPGWNELVVDGKRRGPKDAPVTIVEFIDYECPYCRALERPITSLRELYPDRVAVVYRHFPLPQHRYARFAAAMAECAADLGAFEPVHLILSAAPSLAAVSPDEVARSAGVEQVDRFVGCVLGDERSAVVDRDHDLALSLGFTGTPSIVVNGTFLALADSAKLFAKVEELLGYTGS